ncbi:MAG TPA: NAD(P)-dependent oxidoreductase [Polyangiaceae bacterium]|nr:NAD(P)-dependent oxidoreductase [Polyangiaceae bacterium]
MSVTPPTTLLTGASGFVGRHALAPLAARGHRIVAVSRRRPLWAPEGVRWVEADLLDEAGRAHAVAAAGGATHLLHFAWYAEHGKFWHAPDNRRWADATGDLVARFAAAGGRRAVGAGSCAEYDWTLGGVDAFREGDDARGAPQTPYGVEKLRAARALLGRPGLSAAWGRIFYVFGEHESPARLVPSVARALASGGVARIGPGEQLCDFLDVRDAAEAFVALLESGAEGAVNVGSGERVRVADLARLLADLAGRPGALEVGALPPRPGEPPRLVPDLARLRAEVGFRPARSLREGLGDTLAYWRRQPAPGLT